MKDYVVELSYEVLVRARNEHRAMRMAQEIANKEIALGVKELVAKKAWYVTQGNLKVQVYPHESE